MKRVAVLGGGLIGSGWAAVFAAGGLDAVVLDSDPGAQDRLDRVWASARDVIAQLGGLSDDAAPPRIVRTPDELGEADFLQEALPERLELKHRVLAEVEPYLREDVVIASSSSGFTADQVGEGLARPERVLIGHPCNPSYLMPVVEIAGGMITSASAMDTARGLYESLGKIVLTLKKPVPGHLVNRLQAAIWREAVHLVTTGAASMEDTEAAVTHALGPRWSLVGPSTVFALSGAEAGMHGFLDALGEPIQAIWDDLGTPSLDSETNSKLVEAYGAAALPTLEAAARMRDRALPAILKQASAARAGAGQEAGEEEVRRRTATDADLEEVTDIGRN